MKTLLIAAVIITTALTACSKSQNRKDVEAYSTALCEREGLTQKDELRGCVAAKTSQLMPARKGSGYVWIPQKSGTICRQIGNTNQCN